MKFSSSIYQNHRIAMLVENEERRILNNFYKIMEPKNPKCTTKKCKAHNAIFAKLKELVLIHVDLNAG